MSAAELRQIAPSGGHGPIIPDWESLEYLDPQNEPGQVTLEYPSDGVRSGLLVPNQEYALLVDGVEVPNGRFRLDELDGNRIVEGGPTTKWTGSTLMARFDEVLLVPNVDAHAKEDVLTPEEAAYQKRLEKFEKEMDAYEDRYDKWVKEGKKGDEPKQPHFRHDNKLEKGLDSAPPPPSPKFKGDTPGQVFRYIFQLGQERGAVPELRVSFSAGTDSSGSPWATRITNRWDAGTTLLEVIQWMVENEKAEFYMTGRTLNAFNPGSGIDRSHPPVLLARGKNLVDGPRQATTKDLATYVFCISDTGVHGWVWNAAMVQRYGRIEGKMSASGVDTWDELQELGAAYITQNSQPRWSYTYGVVPGAGADPYKQYNVGDWIYVLDGPSVERLRVKQIGMSFDKNRNCRIAVTLNDVIVERQLTDHKLLRSIVGRTAARSTATTGGGGAANAFIDADGLAPKVPSAPLAVAKAGSVSINYDGLDKFGDDAVWDQAYVEVHIGDTSDFVPTTDTLYDTIHASGSSTVNILPYNVGKYVRFVAVDGGGDKSAPSDAVLVTTPKITGDDLSVSIPELSDGSPPASSPDAEVLVGVDSLFVKWDPVDNADPVTYSVYMSTSSPVAIDSGHLLGTTNATMVSTTADPAGASLAEIPYYFRIVASDFDGDAAPGAEDFATPVILANDLSDLQGQLDSLSADLVTLNTVTIPGLDSDIAGLTSDLSALDSDLTAAESSITTLQGKFPITAPDIAANAVIAGKIAANAVNTAQIVADAVTAAQIATGAVGSGELAANSVIAGKIAAGTIVAADIAADTITGAQIAALTITTSELAAGSVNASKIVAASITATELAASSVTATQIDALAVTTVKLAANAVTAAKIAAHTITAAEIAANTITANEIAAATITATQIAANTITAAKIAAGTITGTEIAAGAITAVKIAADTITSNELAAGSVTATEIAAGAVTANHVTSDVVDGKTINGVSLNIGANIRLNPTEGLYVAQPSGSFIQLPADGSDAIVQARLVATSLTMKGDGQFYGTSLLSGTFRASKGIPDPSTAPTLSSVYITTAVSSLVKVLSVTDNAAGTHWLVVNHTDAIPLGAPARNTLYWIDKTTLAVSGSATLTGWNGADVRVVRTSGGLWALDLSSTWLQAAITSTGVGNATIASPVSTGVSPSANQSHWCWGADGADLLLAESYTTSGNITVKRYNPATLTVGTTTTLTSGPAASANIKSVQFGSFDYGSSRWIVGNTTFAWVWNATPTFQSGDSFYLDFTNTNEGLTWDGTRFWSVGTGLFSKYSTLKADAVTYSRYTWEDTNATGGTHHTANSPSASVNRLARSYLRVQGLPAPQTTTGNDDVNMVVLYAGTGGASLCYLQSPQPALGSSTQVYETIVNSGTLSYTTSTVTGDPGSIESETLTSTTGWQYKGDGSGHFGPVALSTAGLFTSKVLPVADTGWVNFSYDSGWANYGSGFATGQYRVLGEWLYIKGLVQRTGVPVVALTRIFLLPVGARPPLDQVFAQIMSPAGTETAGGIYVQASGAVSVSTATMNTSSYAYINLPPIYVG